MQEDNALNEVTINEAIKELEINNTFNSVDPSTIAAVISIGKNIYDFLEQDESSNGNDDWLEDINSNLGKISSQLIQIADAINRLSVKLDEKFRDLAKNQVIGRVNSLRIVNISWRSNNDEQLNSPEVQGEIARELSAFLAAVRTLMEHGYAHYDTIALAMRLEFYLLNVSNRHKTKSFITSLQDYLAYFQESINPNEKDSLAHRLVVVEGIMRQYSETYKAGNIIKYSRKRGALVSAGTNRWCETRIRKFIKVGGDIVNGFSFSKAPELTNVEKYDCFRETRHHDNHREFVKRVELSHTIITHPEITNHKNAHVRYTKELAPSKQVLDAAIAQVKLYITIIETNLNSPTI